jgi:mannose-6-phosphate isomerase
MRLEGTAADQPIDLDAVLAAPLHLPPNRVYRSYLGGVLQDTFRGAADPVDTDHPEDWVGSVTPAVNPPEHTYPGEGLSRFEVDGRTYRLADLLAAHPEAVGGHEVVSAYGATTGLLLKLLDAAQRLPVHVHPDRDFARHVLHSSFGKAEAWIVMATRQMPGQPSPRVWLGLREDVTRDQLADWVGRQDVAALRGAMHEFEVGVGDAIFVRPGLLHATGAGCFLFEAQEPTDFGLMAEHAGYPIDPEAAHMGLGWDVGLDAIDRSGLSLAALSELRPRSARIAGGDAQGWLEEDLLGQQSHAYFRVHRMTIDGRVEWPHRGTFGIVVVTDGRGVTESARGRVDVVRGDTLAILAETAPTTFEGDLRLLIALAPMA